MNGMEMSNIIKVIALFILTATFFCGLSFWILRYFFTKKNNEILNNLKKILSGHFGKVTAEKIYIQRNSQKVQRDGTKYFLSLIDEKHGIPYDEISAIKLSNSEKPHIAIEYHLVLDLREKKNKGISFYEVKRIAYL